MLLVGTPIDAPLETSPPTDLALAPSRPAVPPAGPETRTTPSSHEPPPPRRFATREPKPRRPKVTPRSGIHFSGGAGVGTGAVADVAAVLRLSLGWSWRWVRLGVRANYWVPRRHVAPGTTDDRGGYVQAGTVGPQVCFRPQTRAFEFPLCVHLGAGGGRVDGFGPQTDSDGGPWVEVGGSAGVAWAFLHRERWRLALALDASADAPLVSVGYTIDGAELYTPSAVAVSGTLGLAAHFFVQTSR